MKKFLLLIAVFSVFMLQSCVQRIGDFTLMSTKNVSIGEKYVSNGTFEADDLHWIILVIPTGTPNLKTCIDNLLEKGKGELATNVVLSNKSLPLILVNQYGFIIKGDVWKRATVGQLNDPNVKKFELFTLANGEKQLVSCDNPNVKLSVFNGDVNNQ